jgi:ABC-type branched-subunit amino acid transport system ATPase component
MVSERRDPEPAALNTASLAAGVINEERVRPNSECDSTIGDATLPGVGDDALSLRQGIRAGGTATLATLALLNAFDELDSAAATLLAPEIQATLGVSDVVIAVITVGGLLLVAAGGLAFGRLADNSHRPSIVGVATLAWSAVVVATGFVQNAFWYFVARSLTALGKANTGPVQGAILADSYPIASRARVYAVNSVVGRVGGLIAPLALGSATALIGGEEAWRWAFWVGALPTFVLAVAVLRLPDPTRGQFEQISTLGTVIGPRRAPPISMGATWQRIRGIRTFRVAIFAFGALGFSFVSVPLFVNLYLEERFELSAFERSLVTSVPGFLALAVLPLVARSYDRLYSASPPRALVLVGALFLPLGLLIPIQMSVPSPIAFAVVGALSVVISSAIFAMVQPLFASITPARLRSQGVAIGTGLILGTGGIGGAVLGGLLSDAFGPRWAVILIATPANLIGGITLINGARFIRADLALVAAEIADEQQESERLRAEPDRIPVVQIRDIDFAYDTVQVLFDVGFEVARGETLALLGTNGAGKSTALRVISGLAIPSRGAVRLNGQTITLTSVETRVRLGIHHVPGGRAVFESLSVRANLEMAAFIYRDPAEAHRRIDRTLERFPVLAERASQRAGELSGGQQQTLGIAMAMIHDPEILLIDELSLGLAPAIVDHLVGVLSELKASGQTMIIVDQSLSTALALADRAVFMEKGRIRFEGATADLIARNDLARAVFLGGGPR